MKDKEMKFEVGDIVTVTGESAFAGSTGIVKNIIEDSQFIIVALSDGPIHLTIPFYPSELVKG